MHRLLILGGTSEAARLARDAWVAFGQTLDIVTSLAGRLPTVPDLPGRVRVGGFGGADALAEYLVAEHIDAVIDATHPFAAAISANAAQACTAAAVARLMLVRPAWAAEAGDRWHVVDSFAAAAALLPDLGTRVFLATGPGSVDAFSALAGLWFVVRLFASQADPLPLPRHLAIVARPPFTLEGEAELMQQHRIDVLVTKNSGGPTAAKLIAARRLGLPAVVVARPALPSGEVVETVDEALGWLRRTCH